MAGSRTAVRKAGRGRTPKQGRPEEIIEAALAEFAAHGFEATRLEDVAVRAGAAKGTIYLHFPNKEELFKASVRHVLVPRIDQLRLLGGAVELSAEETLRRQLATIGKAAADPRLRDIVRLIIGESGRFPEIADFYFDEVVSRGMAAIRAVVARGVEHGEFRASKLAEFPQLAMGPLLLAVIWKSLFDRKQPLDLQAYTDAHMDLLLDGLRAKGR
jgi:AcrR family transcriptional regulator